MRSGSSATGRGSLMIGTHSDPVVCGSEWDSSGLTFARCWRELDNRTRCGAARDRVTRPSLGTLASDTPGHLVVDCGELRPARLRRSALAEHLEIDETASMRMRSRDSNSKRGRRQIATIGDLIGR